MRKFVSLCLALLIIAVSCVSVSASVIDPVPSGKTIITIDDWTYERIDGDKHWRIVDYVGEDAELIVPRIVNDVMVVSLGSYSFANDTSITSVETSSPLWTVEEYAFYGCTSLQSFECNFALKNIGVGAFLGTSSLKNINLEDSVVEVISAHAFTNSGIEEVALPDTCTKIDNYAFGQCASLKKITIPQSVTEIHEDAFKSSDSVVIYCYTDSYAHQYAEAKGIEYVLIDAPVEVTFILGDADGDGSINVLDATTIQKCIASIITDDTGMIHLAGNLDGIGNLNILHATGIQKWLASLPTEYSNVIGTEASAVLPKA